MQVGFELAGAGGKSQASHGGDAGVVLAAQRIVEKLFAGRAAGADEQGVASDGWRGGRYRCSATLRSVGRADECAGAFDGRRPLQAVARFRPICGSSSSLLLLSRSWSRRDSTPVRYSMVTSPVT